MLMTPAEQMVGDDLLAQAAGVDVEEDAQPGDGRPQPQRRPVPAGRGQHHREEPIEDQGAKGGQAE
jgi:hypothetical protein